MTDDRWERWVGKTLKGTNLRKPSGLVLRRAAALGSRLEGQPAGLGAWIVRALFDSALEPAAAGVRGSSGGERRLLFECRASTGGAVHQLDLRLRHVGGHLELTGQLLPPWPGAGLTVRASGARRRGKLGPSGEFLLRSLPARARELHVEIGGVDGATVDVPPIALEADESR